MQVSLLFGKAILIVLVRTCQDLNIGKITELVFSVRNGIEQGLIMCVC